ncbi:MAG TPA: hypothetical protein VHF27_03105 [Acidimicrobiales bacterium]|nr:hypothetical protein [Acidimicrobiales bacterium]
MGDDYVDDGEPTGPSRREFIRRGALLLGVGAWAAPLVQVVAQRGHREGGDGDSAPDVIGVQQVVDPTCATCPAGCAEVVFCGEPDPLGCVCVPSPDPYPMAACMCAAVLFCDEAQQCTTAADCPPGQPCLQGCCPFPICLPPCEEPAPIVGPAPEGIQARSTSPRPTFTSAG